MRQRHAGPGLCPSLPPKAAGTNSDKKAGMTARLSASRPLLYLLEGGGVSCRLAPASRRLRTRRVLVEHMRGEWQRGAMLAYASLPPKAAESNTDKATSWLARGPCQVGTNAYQRSDLFQQLYIVGRDGDSPRVRSEYRRMAMYSCANSWKNKK